MTKFTENEFVAIKKYADDQYNKEGRIAAVYPGDRYWVVNLNQPFSGTVSDIFEENELEKIKKPGSK